MKLDKKLDRWQQAGLIDAQTASGIRDFESGADRPIVLWAVGAIGAFAIALGLVSIVASNWAEIGDDAKLAAAFAVGSILAVSIYRILDFNPWSDQEPGSDPQAHRLWLRETLIIVFYGFNLASLALVGQIYQLGGSVGSLLLFWSLGTAGVVFLGRGRALGVFFFLGLLATYSSNSLEWIDARPDNSVTARVSRDNLGILLTGLAPVISLIASRVLARLATLLRRPSHFSDMFDAGAWVLLFVLGVSIQILWYDSVSMIAGAPRLTLWACLFVGAALAASIPRLYPAQSPRAHLGMRITILLIYASGVFAAGFDHPEMSLVGAVFNLVFMAVMAWTALQAGSRGSFNILTAAIGLRIVVIYFEVFGSLLETGLGLVGGGGLTLFIAWLWVRKSGALASQLTERGEP